MEESGYAGFIMPIEVYFKNKVGSRSSSEKDFHRRGGGAGAACGRECWSHSERISELECRRTKWGVRLMWEAGAGEPACWDGGWECTWMWPSRGAAGPHPCSVALQVCVGPESAVTCHDRARFCGWS